MSNPNQAKGGYWERELQWWLHLYADVPSESKRNIFKRRLARRIPYKERTEYMKIAAEYKEIRELARRHLRFLEYGTLALLCIGLGLVFII